MVERVTRKWYVLIFLWFLTPARPGLQRVSFRKQVLECTHVLSTIKHILFQNKTVCIDGNYTCVWEVLPLQVFLESFWGVHWTNHLSPTEQQKTHDYFQNYHFICRYFIVFMSVVTSRWLMWFQWVRGEDRMMKTHLVLRQAVSAGRELAV